MSNTAYVAPNEDKIREDVAKEVAAEIEGAVAPLEGSIGYVETEREEAASRVGDIYGAAIADATSSTERIRGDYAQAVASEQSIMAEARNRLNELRQSRAAEAQRLAQQIGGPVPIGEFTDPADLEASLFSSESAGSLLKATGLAQAGVQHAEAYSGRVLPLRKAEEMVATRAAFNKEILRIRGEIAAIKAQKGGLINERTRQRLLEEREFALQTAVANRDWEMAKRSAQIERDRIRLQEQELYGNSGGAKGGGRPTLGAQAMTAEQRAARAQAVADRRAQAFELVEALMNPGTEDVTYTQFFPTTPDTPGAFWNGNQWVVAKDIKTQITRPSITNPNELATSLRGFGLPKSLVNEVVRARFPDWIEGKAESDPSEPNRPNTPTTNYTKSQLIKMSPTKVVSILRGLGFKQPVPKGIVRKQKTEGQAAYLKDLKDWAIYWILRRQDIARGESVGAQAPDSRP